MEIPRKFIIAELSIRKLGSSYSTDEDPSLRIESSAITNLHGVSTKLNKYIVLYNYSPCKRTRNLLFSIDPDKITEEMTN